MTYRKTFLLACLASVAALMPALAQRGMPTNATVLTGSNALAVFRQCSRATPAGISGYWVPTASDVSALEAALPGFLAAKKPLPSSRDRDIARDFHQCAGFVRGGRRWIYVNGFAPRVGKDMAQSTLAVGSNKGRKFNWRRDRDRPFNWRRDSVDVCDGGASFWGVEYDVQKRTFQNLNFNGR